MTTDIVLIDEKTIKDKMYYIRGQYVMIDSDLAQIYGYETRYFNRQVKNNIDKFDEDFMFQLIEDEYKNLMCKNFTSSLGGKKKNALCFYRTGNIYVDDCIKRRKSYKTK